GWARAAAEASGGSVELRHDARGAAEGADVLYTDVWTSMGQDEEREQRVLDLAGYRIDDELLGLASERAIVLHCLPAHYSEEITEEVLYGPRSAVWDQAENRLHAQKALMALIIRSGCRGVLPLSDTAPTRRFPIVTVASIAANFAVWVL